MSSFSTYKSLSETLKEFQITYAEDSYIQELPFEVSDYFRTDLKLMMEEGVVDSSEYAICENLVYPVLKEVWKQYRQHFILWSHHFLSDEAGLSGFPEYILARRSPLGKVVFDKPYFLLIEAKQDDFEGAWAQCLSEMVAAQRINDNPELVVHGITSNGTLWQFGKLAGAAFSKSPRPVGIYELDRLFATVNYVFQQCENQLTTVVAA
jgi:hypothetical protein